MRERILKQAKVGNFFVVNGELVFDAVPLEQGELYFPRGRVVYFNESSSFRLYADRCMRKADIEKVAKAFQLPAYRLARDEHYQCANCNSAYVDI